MDPGDQRIGLAISDPSGTIAGPLTVVKHVARTIDAATHRPDRRGEGRVSIVVGQAMDEDGKPLPQGRKSARLAEAIQQQTNLPVELWDESGSTAEARASRLAMGVRRSRRGGHLDDIAATVILQSYLEAQHDFMNRRKRSSCLELPWFWCWSSCLRGQPGRRGRVFCHPAPGRSDLRTANPNLSTPPAHHHLGGAAAQREALTHRSIRTAQINVPGAHG